MSDELQLNGKTFVSSKEAAKQTGYAQDYIGQLARKSLIEASRVGGLWYVSMDSLLDYQKKAAELKPVPSVQPVSQDPATLVFFDGKEYVSASRAAEITGYVQDYVGQLARSGTVLSRQVGNRWYIEKESIVQHKKEKDALLAAVQAESVGLKRPEIKINQESRPVAVVTASAEPLHYYKENGDLTPKFSDSEAYTPAVAKPKDEPIATMETPEHDSGRVFAIKKIRTPVAVLPPKPHRISTREPSPIQVRRSLLPLILTAAATIVIVLSAGFVSLLKQNSVYAMNIKTASLPAAVENAVTDLGNFLEPILTQELNYQRPADTN